MIRIKFLISHNNDNTIAEVDKKRKQLLHLTRIKLVATEIIKLALKESCLSFRTPFSYSVYETQITFLFLVNHLLTLLTLNFLVNVMDKPSYAGFSGSKHIFKTLNMFGKHLKLP